MIVIHIYWLPGRARMIGKSYWMDSYYLFEVGEISPNVGSGETQVRKLVKIGDIEMRGNMDIRFTELFADTLRNFGTVDTWTIYKKMGMEWWEFNFWMVNPAVGRELARLNNQ
jgi:hypothetical protein